MENIQNDYPNIPVNAKKNQIRVLELLPNVIGTKIHRIIAGQSAYPWMRTISTTRLSLIPGQLRLKEA